MGYIRINSVDVEAIQYVITKEIQCKFGIHKEDNSIEIAEFIGEPIYVHHIPNGTKEGRRCITDMIDKNIELNIGDFLVKEPSGIGFYVISFEEFEKLRMSKI